MSFFEKLKKGLQKTKNALFKPFSDLFKSLRRIDEDLMDELEEILICADVGANTTELILDKLRMQIKEKGLKDSEDVKKELRQIMLEMIGEGADINYSKDDITVVLIIGVNGVGKTTSIGKISHSMKKSHKKVVVAAADTFRAAAIDQLEVWTKRAGVDMVKHTEGSDPAAVVFDAINASKKRGADVLIIDTAGRLHNKKNLMDELAKIDRVISRELPNSTRETLLVLDSTTGQNAVNQAKEFKNSANITGLILTKLDGTAKGGIVFSIKNELDIPVKFIGVGEQIDDMEKFDANDFVDALFE
ncbi:MAG: signal recognition particle-docking protein FtsY [Ruminococcaceae bacterium]|nr:signal recognition particle-docking protein FtsY [Oscillospiraceae bacterium]